MKQFYFLFRITAFITACLVQITFINAQTMLGVDGGVEGTATIRTSTTNSPLANLWTRSATTVTPAIETSEVRSGSNSLKITSTGTGIGFVFTPLFSLAAATTQQWVVQYFRKATNGTPQHKLGARRNSNNNVETNFSNVESGPSWTKRSFVTGTINTSTVAGIISNTGVGTAYVDDICIYQGTAEDNTPPDAPINVTAAQNSSNPSSEINIQFSAPATGVDGGGIMIVRYDVMPNADNDPNQNGIYSYYPVQNVITNGTGSLQGTVIFVGSGISAISTGGLQEGTTYYFKVYTFDKAYNYSNEVLVSATTKPRSKFYAKATGNLNSLSSWTSDPMGGAGSQPPSFTANYQDFYIVDNNTHTVGGNWTVSGTSISVTLGNGTNTPTLIFPGGSTISCQIDVKANATLEVQNFDQPVFASTPYGNIKFTGSGAQSIPSYTYRGNMTISGSGTKTFSGTSTVYGNLTVKGSATMVCPNSLIIKGNLNIEESGVFDPGTVDNTVTFNENGSTINSTGPVNFMGLRIYKSGGNNVYLNGDVVVNKALQLYTSVVTYGNLSLGSHKLTLNGTILSSLQGVLSGSKTADLVIGSNYSNGSSSIYFDQSTATSNYLNSITASANVTLGSKLQIAPSQNSNGATTGFVRVNPATTTVITLKQNLVLTSDSTGTARIDAGPAAGSYFSFNPGRVTVQYYMPPKRAWRLLTAPITNLDVTISNSWQEGQVYKSTDGKTYSAADWMYGDYTKEVTVDTGYGTHITCGTTPPFNVSQNAMNLGFDYGVSNIGSGSSLRIFDNDNKNWKLTVLTDGTFGTPIAGQAYMVFVRGDRTIQLANSAAAPTPTILRATGEIGMGDTYGIQVPAKLTLVQNPFPSPISFENLFTKNPNQLRNVFWVWDSRLNPYGGYRTIKRVAANDYVEVPWYDINRSGTPTNLQNIQSGQAFFVDPPSTVATSFNIAETDKTSNTNAVVYSNRKSRQLYVNLYQASGTATALTDGVLATYDDNGSNAVDLEDIQKPANLNENLSIYRGGKTLVIESRAALKGNDTLFLRLTGSTQRAYQFKMRAGNFTGGYSATLEDSYLKTSTPINLESGITSISFTINSNAASQKADRFMVIFRPNIVLPVTMLSVKAYQLSNAINVDWSVSNETGITEYEIEKSVNGFSFDKVGTVKAKNALTTNEQYLFTDNQPVQGLNYYRVKTVSANGETKYSAVVTVKVIQDQQPAISVYPNPLRSQKLVVQFTDVQKGLYNIDMFNSVGQKVYNTTVLHAGGTMTEVLNIGQKLPAGVYSLQVNGAIKRSFKVMVE